MPDANGQKLDDAMLQCIELCLDCHKACHETMFYCLQMGGKHAAADHIRLMMDCTEICLTSAHFMQRGSELHHHTCRACAAVCEKCAEDCESMGEDSRMAACATMCRRCAESCKRMSGDAIKVVPAVSARGVER